MAKTLRAVLGALIGTSALLGGAASAKTVVGSYDPGFGPPFASLGYTVDVAVYVPDGCFSGVGTTAVYVVKTDLCSASDPNGGIHLLSAKVNLYNTGGPGSQTLTYATQLTPFTSDLATDPLNGVVLQQQGASVLGIGVSSIEFGNNSGAIQPTDPLITAITGTTKFKLRLGPDYTFDWDDDGDPVPDPDELLEHGTMTNAAATEFGKAYLSGYGGSCDTAPACLSNPATGAFTTIPEPGSFGLALAALGAFRSLRRRSRSA